LLGETQRTISKMYGDGDYIVRILEDGSCKITQVYTFKKPIKEVQVKKTICFDQTYKFGDKTLDKQGKYTHSFKGHDQCDSIVHLDLSLSNRLEDTIYAKIFEGDVYKVGKFSFKTKGTHKANIKSSIGCDSLLYIQLDFFKVYIPNIFSPNNDGYNDFFTMYSGEESIEKFEFKIYDRWGGHMFSGQTWDGRYKDTALNNGIYTYVLSIHLTDNRTKYLSGSVTIVN